MSSMFAVGSVCWFINIILLALYAYETRKIVTKRGVVLKGLSSFGVVAYAVVLMIMWGTVSDAGKVFLLGILLVSVGDVLIGISTSGNSQNVIRAMKTAHALGGSCSAFTGKAGGQMAAYADVLRNVDETETYRVQEKHLPLYHQLCMRVEAAMFGDAE